MGYLLKEALKTLCGVNQWSYAVFWKFGYQNPKLLIWEESYQELDSNSRRPWIVSGNKNLENVFQDFSNSWVSEKNCNLPSGAQAQDTVHLLVNKMMMENHVNIVGEGLVGRVAFTGNHQWILSENYYGEANPPEVVKEVCQQLSAGIKTIVVIPVLPHGVVQFGSYLSISENLGFINNVASLVLQLGNIPGTLLSDSHASKELGPKIGVPACLGNSIPCDSSFESNTINASTFVTDSIDYVGSSIPVIPSSIGIWRNQHASLYVPSSSLVLPSGSSSLAIENTKTISLIGYGSDGNRTGNENIASKCSDSSGHRNVNLSKMESSFSVSVDNLTANSLHYYSYVNQPHHFDKKRAQGEFFASNKEIGQNINQISDHMLPQQNKHLNASHSGNYSKYDDPCSQLQSGDDLFDIFGANFKNKMFRSCWSSCMNNESESTPEKHISDNNNICSKSLASLEPNGTSQGNLDSVIFSTGTDHLLDAVVSTVTPTVTQSANDSVSCRTSLTNSGTSSAPNGSLLPYGLFDQVKGELFGVPKYLATAGAMSSCSLRTLPSKEEKGTYSPSSSIYGSQISSWIEKSQNTKQDNSVSTGCSKKPSETCKTNRKRLKPGENPRPRPKDRQMIQDRVKELRELVPNGAKCSIDSLLERTIKHMLFLQSVTKHADKLKQTGESKLIGKDGNLLLKENFEGGATWAYEIGLQSMVCPIIVEDLNQPRQMLVEMLCEERGLFLEIADIIRGLGLTILKGVMETRNDKIWARFAVEANRDVTRMEIFISLVRLLEQSAKDVVPQDEKMVQQFHQIAALPVSGISDIMH